MMVLENLNEAKASRASVRTGYLYSLKISPLLILIIYLMKIIEDGYKYLAWIVHCGFFPF